MHHAGPHRRVVRHDLLGCVARSGAQGHDPEGRGVGRLGTPEKQGDTGGGKALEDVTWAATAARSSGVRRSASMAGRVGRTR